MARSPDVPFVALFTRIASAALLLASMLGAPLAAQKPAPLKLDSYTLPNGLKVILAEDHTPVTMSAHASAIRARARLARRVPDAAPAAAPLAAR